MVVSSKASSGATITGEWECDGCGYTRRGILRSRPLRCPECGVSSDSFSFWSDDDEDVDDADVGDADEDEDWEEEEEEDWDDDDDSTEDGPVFRRRR